ncbi:MAG: tRNA uracil 4-sulfurtransferase ThiI [Pseudohongiellaceae bacterium]|nr:tRNA uracil 4-sulfurtransferase ThiI [Pseudohongiellaceae bacterium]
MLFVVRFFPEITIKSRSVRKRFIRVLRRSIKTQLSLLDPQVSVVGEWDNLAIETLSEDAELLESMMSQLRCTPGIASVMQVSKCELPDMEGILAKTAQYYEPLLKDKTFVVRCKRAGKHDFTSMDVERYLGAALLRSSGAKGVRMKDPDVTVRVEIINQQLLIVERFEKGLGGYPLGTQDGVLSLISGGFDSCVSSFMCIRRGLLTHYCFFNLGGKEHELAVKEVALYLWMKYGASHRVKFVSVPFEGVVEEILKNVSQSQMGVILKRMMMRAADKVAQDLKLEVLVTGESVAQVASQTLANLAIIDRVTDKLILRPLITTDKQEIIDLAKEIGTEEFSKNIPEYCGVISNKPTTRARTHRIEQEEENFNFGVLDQAVADREIQMIDKVVEGIGNQAVEVETVDTPPAGSTVIDIRHPDEEEMHPLHLPDNSAVDLIKMPFYELRSRSGELKTQSKYYLYCDKGIMSRLHASHLKDAGFTNIGVFRP